MTTVTSRSVVEYMQVLEGKEAPYSETERREPFDSRLMIAVLVGIAIIAAYLMYR